MNPARFSTFVPAYNTSISMIYSQVQGFYLNQYPENTTDCAKLTAHIASIQADIDQIELRLTQPLLLQEDPAKTRTYASDLSKSMEYRSRLRNAMTYAKSFLTDLKAKRLAKSTALSCNVSPSAPVAVNTSTTQSINNIVSPISSSPGVSAATQPTPLNLSAIPALDATPIQAAPIMSGAGSGAGGAEAGAAGAENDKWAWFKTHRKHIGIGLAILIVIGAAGYVYTKRKSA